MLQVYTNVTRTWSKLILACMPIQYDISENAFKCCIGKYTNTSCNFADVAVSPTARPFEPATKSE